MPRSNFVGGLTVLAFSMLPTALPAYPIDCAILLCLAGGFPASSECAAARVEMIRRITPFPIEPPLQLWNCPMGGGAGIAPIGGGSDGLPPEVRAYRDGVEIYHINYRQTHGRDDMHIVDRSMAGSYDDAGDFHWSRSPMRDAPDWIFEATGISAHAVRSQTGTIMRWRGVLMRWRDHEGQISTEWVRY